MSNDYKIILFCFYFYYNCNVKRKNMSSTIYIFLLINFCTYIYKQYLKIVFKNLSKR